MLFAVIHQKIQNCT